MDKKEFLDYLYNKKRFGNRLGVDTMKDYTKYLSYPEKDMKIIHIAGTNGKGSTASILGQILIELGFNVGLFTSPHLVSFNERIKFNGKDIDDNKLLAIGKTIKDIGDRVNSTMFDDSLAIALLYFKEKKADFVILETGLGGRLDATTGINNTPSLSIITRIGLDHTKYLGNDLISIAKEKAGILKVGTTLILGENDTNVENHIISIAKEKGLDSITVRDFFGDKNHLSKYKQHNDNNEIIKDNLKNYTDEQVKNNRKTYDSVKFLKKNINKYIEISSLQGTYQKENIKCALLSIFTLYRKGILKDNINLYKDVPREDTNSSKKTLKDSIDLYKGIENGLKKVSWNGRFQIIKHNPTIIIDGAHNPNGVKALLDSLCDNYKDTSFIGVFSVLKDKDRLSMYKLLKDRFIYIYAVNIDSDRALDGHIIKSELDKYGIDSSFEENPIKAINIAIERSRLCKDKTLIVCFGSLYMIGEILKNKDNLS